MKTNSKTPKLRFRDFEDSWIQYDVNAKIQEYSLGGNYENSELITDKPLIKMGNIGRGNIVLDKIEYIVVSENINSNDLIKEGDLFFNTRNTLDLVGKVAIWKNELPIAYYNSNLMRITFDNNYFMNYRFNSYSGIKGLRRLATGTTSVAAIYTRDFLKLKLYYPSLPEQQKIASFLSAVDKKIQQLTRKKELLEQYKKGVMQKIFSQEIRFKPALSGVEGDDDGKNFLDWEEKRLGDIIQFFPTNSCSRDDMNYDKGDIKNIHYGDIHTKYKMGFNVKEEVVPYITNSNDSIKITEDQFCKNGDVVIADASEDYKDIGKTIEIINIANEKVVAGLHTFLGRDINEMTVVGFKGYLFQTNLIRKQIQKIAQGISVLGISKKNLDKLVFLLPCKTEQMKIVQLLKDIDCNIEITKKKLEKIQKFKKGLLQQMFV